ncbi:DUF3302 domain-containing protein [Aliamphritea ceti]|uniref:DUF3302 domain-containing protein n=1 Tax=Aliamphritea ceti TaxID=1524258 RepID=UPI0021C2826B|nr:DUF3302 domain-containing protein [Aliamphritea ceti]
MFLDYVALFLIFFVGIFVFYAVIVIHDIPYEIAVHRNHPHQDAIHVAGWVSLFTLHVLWPFLWIWSTLYREDRGWGFKHHVSDANGNVTDDKTDDLASLQQQVNQLQEQLQKLDSQQQER